MVEREPPVAGGDEARPDESWPLAETLAAHALWARSRGREGLRADLRGADLRDVRLDDATLRAADLYQADLRGAHVRGADFRGVNLAEADLQDTDLSAAKDLTQDQIDSAYADAATHPPPPLKLHPRPYPGP